MWVSFFRVVRTITYEILINFHTMWVSFINTNATNRLDQYWKNSYQHS